MRASVRRALATITVAAVAAGLLSACVPDDEPNREVVAVLEEAGIPVTAGIDEIVPESGLFGVTEFQADVMQGEVDAGGGLIGADLDQIVPMPEGGVPYSFVIAAWLDLAETDRARAAAGFFPEETSWFLAQEIAFPHVALLLFVADNLEAAEEDVPEPQAGADDGPALALASRAVPLLELPAAPCSAISTAYGSLIERIFSAIRIPPDFLAGGGVLGQVSGFLAGLFNHAIVLASVLVKQTIARLTEPVLRAIGEAIAIVGLVSHFSTYLLGVRLEVTSAPYTIQLDGSTPDGMWTARVPADARPLEAQLRDCLAVLGQPPLPEVLRAGEVASWRPEWPRQASGLQHRSDVLGYPSLSSTVQPGASTTLAWVSLPEEKRGSEQKLGTVRIHAEAPRAEVTRLLEIMRSLLADAITVVTGRVPVLGDVLKAAILAILQPIVDAIARDLVAAGRAVLVVGGWGAARFVYTDPPPPSPSPAGGGQPGDGTPCYVGTWAFDRSIPTGAFRWEDSWSWSRFTVSVSADGLWWVRVHDMAAGSGAQGDSFVVRIRYAGYGALQITPDDAGGFRVVGPAEAGRGYLTATESFDVSGVNGVFLNEDTGWGPAFFGLIFQPAYFACQGSETLQITNVTGDTFTGGVGFTEQDREEYQRQLEALGMNFEEAGMTWVARRIG